MYKCEKCNSLYSLCFPQTAPEAHSAYKCPVCLTLMKKVYAKQNSSFKQYNDLLNAMEDYGNIKRLVLSSATSKQLVAVLSYLHTEA